jgi:hypothetical protein
MMTSRIISTRTLESRGTFLPVTPMKVTAAKSKARRMMLGVTTTGCAMVFIVQIPFYQQHDSADEIKTPPPLGESLLSERIVWLTIWDRFAHFRQALSVFEFCPSRHIPISSRSVMEKKVSSAAGRQTTGRIKIRIRIRILVNIADSLHIACNISVHKQRLPRRWGSLYYPRG